MRLIDKDHMIYRLEQASKYFGGEQTDRFDERFSHGLKEAGIKVAEEPEIKAIPLSVLQEIRQDLSEYNIYDHEQVFTDYYDAFNTGIHTALIIIDKHIKEYEE